MCGMNRRTLLAAISALSVTRANAATMRLDLHGSSALVDMGAADADLQVFIRAWIAKSADAVALYYGKFPVPAVDIVITVVDGDRVRGGTTNPGDVPHIEVRVGRASGEAALLRDDWVMVHEMIHLAFPWMNRQHNWMAEGIAVYVEAVARVRAGHLTADRIWRDFVRAMPKGLPKAGDGGLDQTASWGMTYWGGCLFCLLADVRIRRETDNRVGLQHALRAINGSRDFRQEWDFRETLELGDAATGRHVLMSMYDEMKNKPVSPDLDGLWRQLGIALNGGELAFDDKAPLAAIRKAITAI
jgi:hypothetical protein